MIFYLFIYFPPFDRFGGIGKHVPNVNMSLKCIDKSDFNHKLTGQNLWSGDGQIRTRTEVHLFFLLHLISMYFFFNFPLVDTRVPLTELWICYPITVNYCLSSRFLPAFEVLPFQPARPHALSFLYVGKGKKKKPRTHTYSRYRIKSYIQTGTHRTHICPSLTLDQLEKAEATENHLAFFPLKDCINLSADVSI